MSATFVIAQGGGPTAVINQTMVGAVLEARKRHPGCRVLGALHGVRGIRDGNFVDLGVIPEDVLRKVAITPSAALGSTRDKPDAAYCDAVLAGLKKTGADAFIYIGGNDTAGTQQILTEAAAGSMAFVHAPKTIDNDLAENDHTPGFISAGGFVAGAFMSIDLDFRALPGIYVGIIMGRNAGFLTASAAAWRGNETDGPHLVYVPERTFSVQGFIDEIKESMSRHGRCMVALSEGVTTADGKPLVESLIPPDKLERDAHGNTRLSGSALNKALEEALGDAFPGQRSRVDTLGYVPRVYIGTVNERDAREAFEAGAYAVHVAGHGGGSVALQIEEGRTIMRKVALSAVAGKTRHMPESFLAEGRNHLSEACIDYLNDLIPMRPAVGRAFV